MTAQEFKSNVSANFPGFDWVPHPKYSVFTQWDKEHYLRDAEQFVHKYQQFFAVSKTIAPTAIIELGVCAGSGADAYLSATPTARYIGIDIFGRHELPDYGLWDPQEIARKLLHERGFHFALLQTDLRTVDSLAPLGFSDLVVVDAAHDHVNQLADLHLAMTARPQFIFVDDADTNPGLKTFLQQAGDRIEWTVKVPYIGGGLVIKPKI